jgi:hypothetical protein
VAGAKNKSEAKRLAPDEAKGKGKVIIYIEKEKAKVIV